MTENTKAQLGNGGKVSKLLMETERGDRDEPNHNKFKSECLWEQKEAEPPSINKKAKCNVDKQQKHTKKRENKKKRHSAGRRAKILPVNQACTRPPPSLANSEYPTGQGDTPKIKWE